MAELWATVGHAAWPLDLRVGMCSRWGHSRFLPRLFEPFRRDRVTLGKSLSAHGKEEPTGREEQRGGKQERQSQTCLQAGASGAPRHPCSPHVSTS